MIHHEDFKMPYRDPHNLTEFVRAVLALTALISGGVGGGLVGGRKLIRSKVQALAILISYTVVGSGIGFGVFVTSPFLPGLEIHTFADAAMVGFIAGVSGTIALAAGNIAVKFSAKKFGIDEATITVKMSGEDELDTKRKKE